MKNLSTILLVFLCTSYSLFLFGQEGTVSGIVIDEQGQPAEFANVLLLSASDSSLVRGSATELDGSYSIDKITSGDYLISVSLVGYNEAYTPVFTSNNDAISIDDLSLQAGVALEEVMVTAKKPFIELQADKIIVNVENSSVNAGNSALEVLQKSPGVSVDKDNNISLRGKQGVLVTINGKNQYLSGDEITQLLETTPAESINSIEIIANPSAKYDAEGNSGIINIKLKRNDKIGLNGSLEAGMRQGRRFTHNQGLRLNYRSEKVNIYGNLTRWDWKNYQDLAIQRSIPLDGGMTDFDLTTAGNRQGINNDIKMGVDFMLNEKTTIGLLARTSINNRSNTSESMTFIEGSNAPIYSQLVVNNNDNSDRDQYSYNFNIKHLTDDNGGELSLDVDYSTYDSEGLSHYDNLYQNNNGEEVATPFYLRNNQITSIDILAGKLDYSKKIGDISLETGIKLSMVETSNITIFEELQDDQWINQAFRSNSFIYKEDVSAAYVNASRAFGKINVQAGLRLEHTESEGNSVTLENVVARSYTNLFPSLSISHMIGKKHSLSYTYSRRLNRPNYRDLNPFIDYLDQFTFEKGNPFLNPQYSNSFGINYGMGRSLFVSANYNHTTDAITEVIEQVSEDNTTFQTYQNLEDMHSASLTISAPKVWSESWTTRVSLTTFYNHFKSPIPSGTLNNKSAAYHLHISNEIRLPGDFGMELSGSYQSSLTYALFQIKPQYGIDLGFTKSLMKGQANLKVGLDDIFRTRRNQGFILQDDIDTRVLNTRDSRRVKVNFTYKFGNRKVKAARKRRTATEDETSRIGDS